MVIGREQEKQILSEVLQSDRAEFVAVYGRRRVGKTFLVRQYLHEHLVFDFTGSNLETNAIQLSNFNREFKKQCVDNETIAKDWSEAFAMLTDFLHTLDKDKKAVVFIDELPWLDKPKSGFLGALQFFWNQHGSQMKHLALIVCGSAASWIIKNITESTGGLYNRVTQRIELKPFNLSEMEAFLKAKNIRLTHYQMLQLYMVMGGVPFYLDFVKPNKSVHQIIEELCFTQNGILQKEFKMLYHSLFKQAENHVLMVEALAKSPYGLSRKQLLEKTKIAAGGSFLRTIENLLDCGFIIENQAYGKKSKETTFRLIDFYSIFYLRFVKDQANNQKNTWQLIQESNAYQSWCGYAFENIGIAHTEQICKYLGFSGVYREVGSWHFSGNGEISGTQIDLVIDRKDGIIHLFEAKFTQKDFVLSKEYTAKLRQKRTVFSHITKTKKMVVTSLLTTYPAIKNAYYLEEIFNEVPMEALFES